MWMTPKEKKEATIFVGILIAIALVFFFYKSQPMSVGSLETDSWESTLSKDINVYRLGDLDFVAEAPVFICNDLNSNQYLFTNTNKDCWRVVVNGYNYLSGDSLVVNPYLSVKMEIINALHYGSNQVIYPKGTRSDWQIKLTFELINKDFFVANIQDVTTIMFGREHNVTINTDNELANGLSGGFIVSKVDELVHNEQFFEYAKTFSKGIKTEVIPLDTGKLGMTTLEITPYFNIDSDAGTFRLYSTKLGKVYDIVAYEPVDNDLSGDSSQVLPSTEPETNLSSTPKVPSEGLAPAYIYAVLLILGIIVIILWRNKK